MRLIAFLILVLVGGCVSRPATTTVVHTSGFPEAHIATSEGAGPWSGTERCFKSDSGELFYFTVLIDNAYDQYCTAQLEASGITNTAATLGRLTYLETSYQPGFRPNPDRVDVCFLLHDKATGKFKPFEFMYMLPASSQKLGRTTGFSKLGRNEQALLCIKSVTSDMECIAQELVRKLKTPNSG